jgi:hypothetical protein
MTDNVPTVGKNGFVARWLQEGPYSIRENLAIFREMLDQAKALTLAGDYAYAASWCEIAGAHATASHCGLFASRELEQVIGQIARATLGDAAMPRGAADGGRPRRILHVATCVQAIGGLSRMMWRWITEDSDGVHSVALVRQRRSLPNQLVEAVRVSGGQIHNLSERSGSLLDLARRLRDTARGADLIVLHIGNHDIVPLLAFSNAAARPRIAYLDHADHLFWLGTSIADVYIGLRRSGFTLASARRGIDPERSALLPIPLGRIERSLSRREAKRQLGLDEDGILLVSVARELKYRSVEGVSYAETHLPFLKERSDATLTVLGSGQRADWADAQAQVDGRIMGLPESPQTALYYQAADIYVDSFPYVSTTSLLEAGSYGSPLVSRFPFPDGAEILGADMPGLDKTLVRARTDTDYNNDLLNLAESGSRRQDLGEATRQGVAGIHCGEAWRQALEQVYALAARVDPVPPSSGGTDEPCFGVPDVFVHYVHGCPGDRDGVLSSQLHLMPVSRRLSHILDITRRRGFNFDGRYNLLRCWIPAHVVARLR